MEHISQSVECLCHFMTTVGSKLDISKAKVSRGEEDVREGVRPSNHTALLN